MPRSFLVKSKKGGAYTARPAEESGLSSSSQSHGHFLSPQPPSLRSPAPDIANPTYPTKGTTGSTGAETTVTGTAASGIAVNERAVTRAVDTKRTVTGTAVTKTTVTRTAVAPSTAQLTPAQPSPYGALYGNLCTRRLTGKHPHLRTLHLPLTSGRCRFCTGNPMTRPLPLRPAGSHRRPRPADAPLASAVRGEPRERTGAAAAAAHFPEPQAGGDREQSTGADQSPAQSQLCHCRVSPV